MELGNQIEQQKNASERRFGSKELLQAEAIGSAIVLQLFALGSISARRLYSRQISSGEAAELIHENAEGVPWHVDQLSTDAAALLANDDETPGCFQLCRRS
jgi:hypothetical protein